MPDDPPQTRMRWRQPAGLTLVVLGCVLLPLALVAGWVRAEVTDTERYVDTVAPIAEQPEVRQAVTRRLEDAILTRIDVGPVLDAAAAGIAERDLPPAVSRAVQLLQDPATELIEDAVHRVVVRIVEDPEFATAWAQAHRSAHSELVAALSGQTEILEAEDGRVSIKLATVVNAITTELADNGIAVAGRIPVTEASFPIMEVEDLERLQYGYRLVDAVGVILPVITVLLLAAGILIATRRRTGWTVAATGAAVGMALLALGLLAARHYTLDTLPAGTDPIAVRETFDIVVGRIRTLLRLVLAVSVLVLFLSWLTDDSAPAVRLRRRVDELLNGRPGAIGLRTRVRDNRGLVLGGTGAVLALLLTFAGGVGVLTLLLLSLLLAAVAAAVLVS